MIKSIVVFLVLFFTATSAGCGSTLQNGNIFVSCYYYATNADGSIKFMLTINNTVPGSNPNSAAAMISDVNSFAFVNSSSAGAIKRAHLQFTNINGGAANSQYFVVPASMVGSDKCVFIGFAYNLNSAETYFYGSFALDSSKVLPAAKKDDISEDELAARDCGTFTYTGTGYTATSGTATSNPYYWKSGTSATTYSNVSCIQLYGSGIQIGYSYPGPTFGSWAANAQKYGNVNFNAAASGTYTIQCTINYFGPCGSGSASTVQNLVVSSAGGKRSAEIAEAASSLRTEYGVAIASAGLAVAAVAVVAAVVVVRRRTAQNIV